MIGGTTRNAGLGSLMRSPEIVILYDHGIDDTKPKIIYKIPRDVVKHFSPVLQDCFPPQSQPHVNRPGCDGKTFVTVTGSVKPAFVTVFQWMVNYCKSNGKARLEYLSFSKYARIHEAAEILGATAVEKDMLIRMNKIGNGQVPCEDARMVYATYPKESVIRQIVIRSIGNAIINRTLRRWSLYIDLRVECAEYDYDIHEYIEGKKRESRERELQRAKDVQNAGKKNRTSRKAHVQQKSAENVVEKTVKAPIARKGKGGGPSYYKVDLNDLGVSRR